MRRWRLICAAALLALSTVSIGRLLDDNIQNLRLTHMIMSRVDPADVDLTSCDCAQEKQPPANLALRARLFLRFGKWSLAEQCFQHYIEQGGRQRLILVFAAQLAGAQGNWAQAAKISAKTQSEDIPMLQRFAEVHKAANDADFGLALSELKPALVSVDSLSPLGKLLYIEHDQLQLALERQGGVDSPEEELALAIQYWRLDDYDASAKLALDLLSQTEVLSERQQAWAWYLVAEALRADGCFDESLAAYQEGVAADQDWLPNIWKALSLLNALSSSSTECLRANLSEHLTRVSPVGHIQSPDVGTSLVGYTVVPASTTAPEGKYELYLYWQPDSREARQADGVRTPHCAIQRMSTYNMTPYGQFDLSTMRGGTVLGWEKWIFPGRAVIAETPGATAGALFIAPRESSHRVMIRGVPPSRGMPVRPENRYLVTGRMRVGTDGVTTLRCIWHGDTRTFERDANGARGYAETYDKNWRDIGVLLTPPIEARSCELRSAYLFGKGGRLDDVRVFEIPPVED